MGINLLRFQRSEVCLLCSFVFNCSAERAIPQKEQARRRNLLLNLNNNEFTNKIISKYESINTKDDLSISQKIQDFAQELSAVYEKFYPSFLQTLDQHGMYLALIK